MPPIFNETDYAWAARIIDGEGYLGMARNFQIKISIRMTHRKTIERLVKMFGGKFYVHKAVNVSKHKVPYEWMVQDKFVLKVLDRTKRYMLTKREQADLVIEFRSCCFPKIHIGRGRPRPQYLTDLKQAYFDRLKKLNRKGPDE